MKHKLFSLLGVSQIFQKLAMSGFAFGVFLISFTSLLLGQETITGNIAAIPSHTATVDKLGGMTNTFPIWVSETRITDSPLKPSLAISCYNGNTSPGSLGVGCNLAVAVSPITRCVRSENDRVTYTSTDTFCYGDNALIPIGGGANGAENTQYVLEVDDGSLFESHNVDQSGVCEGPCRFTLTKPDGTQWTFGYSPNDNFPYKNKKYTELLTTLASEDETFTAFSTLEIDQAKRGLMLLPEQEKVLQWLPVMKQDRHGNRIYYNYLQRTMFENEVTGNRIYYIPSLSEIYYGNVGDPAGERSVRFIYGGLGRHKISYATSQGQPLVNTNRLDSILVYGNQSTKLRKYQLTYANFRRDFGLIYLASIQELARKPGEASWYALPKIELERNLGSVANFGHFLKLSGMHYVDNINTFLTLYRRYHANPSAIIQASTTKLGVNSTLANSPFALIDRSHAVRVSQNKGWVSGKEHINKVYGVETENGKWKIKERDLGELNGNFTGYYYEDANAFSEVALRADIDQDGQLEILIDTACRDHQGKMPNSGIFQFDKNGAMVDVSGDSKFASYLASLPNTYDCDGIRVQVLDLNKDGYPDLIEESGKAHINNPTTNRWEHKASFNLPTGFYDVGKFYIKRGAQEIATAVKDAKYFNKYFIDLNGDGYKDFIDIGFDYPDPSNVEYHYIRLKSRTGQVRCKSNENHRYHYFDDWVREQSEGSCLGKTRVFLYDPNNKNNHWQLDDPYSSSIPTLQIIRLKKDTENGRDVVGQLESLYSNAHIIDMNGDSLVDIINLNTQIIYINTGSQFEQQQSLPSAWASDIVNNFKSTDSGVAPNYKFMDLDNNGLQDIVRVCVDNNIEAYLNAHDGTWDHKLLINDVTVANSICRKGQSRPPEEIVTSHVIFRDPNGAAACVDPKGSNNSDGILLQNPRAKLLLDSDNKLKLIVNGAVVWRRGDTNKLHKACFSKEGHLKVYRSNGNSPWKSGSGDFLVLTPTCNLELRKQNGNISWQTGTRGTCDLLDESGEVVHDTLPHRTYSALYYNNQNEISSLAGSTNHPQGSDAPSSITSTGSTCTNYKGDNGSDGVLLSNSRAVLLLDRDYKLKFIVNGVTLWHRGDSNQIKKVCFTDSGYLKAYKGNGNTAWKSNTDGYKLLITETCNLEIQGRSGNVRWDIYQEGACLDESWNVDYVPPTNQDGIAESFLKSAQPYFLKSLAEIQRVRMTYEENGVIHTVKDFHVEYQDPSQMNIQLKPMSNSLTSESYRLASIYRHPNLFMPHRLVKSTWLAKPNDGNRHKEIIYGYSDLKLSDKGQITFSRRSITNKTLGTSITEAYEVDSYATSQFGLLSRVIEKKKINPQNNSYRNIKRVDYGYGNASQAPGGVIRPFLGWIKEYHYLPESSDTVVYNTEFNFDNTGRLLQNIVLSGNGKQRVLCFTYQPASTAYHVQFLITNKQLRTGTDCNDGTILQEISREYDDTTTRNLKSETIYDQLKKNGSIQSITTEYEFLSNGRLKKFTNPIRAQKEHLYHDSYADKFNLLQIFTISTDGKSLYESKIIQEFFGFVQERRIGKPGVRYGVSKMSNFDALGRVTVESQPSIDGVDRRFNYNYWKITQHHFSGSNFVVTKKQKIRRNSNDEYRSVETYDATGELIQKKTSAYDSSNYTELDVKIEEYTKDPQQGKTIVTLKDGNGNILGTSTTTQQTYNSFTMTGEIEGNYARTTTQSTTVEGNTVRHQYHDPSALSGVTAFVTEKAFLNKDGLQFMQKYADGTVATMEYDNLNRPIKSMNSVYAKGEGIDEASSEVDVKQAANAFKTVKTYNRSSWLLSIKSPETGTTTFEYNPDGTVKEKIDSMGNVTTYDYDGFGRVAKKVAKKNISGSLETYSTTEYTYDEGTFGVGKLTRVRMVVENSDIFSAGYIVTTGYVYNRNGSVQYKIQDLQDRANLISDSDSDSGVALASGSGSSLDGFEPAVSSTPVYGNISVEGFEYDFEGRLLNRVLPNGRVIRYQYDNPHLSSIQFSDFSDSSALTFKTLANFPAYSPIMESYSTARLSAGTGDFRIARTYAPGLNDWGGMNIQDQTVNTAWMYSEWGFNKNTSGLMQKSTIDYRDANDRFTKEKTFDEMGRVDSATVSMAGAASVYQEDFTYDVSGRLTDYSLMPTNGNGRIQNYIYDTTILTRVNTVLSCQGSYIFDCNANNAVETTTHDYNSNGSLAVKEVKAGPVTNKYHHTYSPEGHLLKTQKEYFHSGVLQANPLTLKAFAYDHEGKLLIRQQNGESTYFLAPGYTEVFQGTTHLYSNFVIQGEGFIYEEKANSDSVQDWYRHSNYNSLFTGDLSDEVTERIAAMNTANRILPDYDTTAPTTSNLKQRYHFQNLAGNIVVVADVNGSQNYYRKVHSNHLGYTYDVRKISDTMNFFDDTTTQLEVGLFENLYSSQGEDSLFDSRIGALYSFGNVLDPGEKQKPYRDDSFGIESFTQASIHNRSVVTNELMPLFSQEVMATYLPESIIEDIHLESRFIFGRIKSAKFDYEDFFVGMIPIVGSIYTITKSIIPMLEHPNNNFIVNNGLIEVGIQAGLYAVIYSATMHANFVYSAVGATYGTTGLMISNGVNLGILGAGVGLYFAGHEMDNNALRITGILSTSVGILALGTSLQTTIAVTNAPSWMNTVTDKFKATYGPLIFVSIEQINRENRKKLAVKRLAIILAFTVAREFAMIPFDKKAYPEGTPWAAKAYTSFGFVWLGVDNVAKNAVLKKIDGGKYNRQDFINDATGTMKFTATFGLVIHTLIAHVVPMNNAILSPEGNVHLTDYFIVGPHMHGGTNSVSTYTAYRPLIYTPYPH